jgi:hypothetical protein
MAKAPVYGPNGGFVMRDKPSGARLGVLQTGRQVAGPGFSNPNFSFKLATEDQLPEFMALRIATTSKKFMFAGAQEYAEGGRSVPITVEGAKLQHGTGHSYSSKGTDGRTYYFGIEAAHFGIGTVTRCGEALSSSASFQVHVWRTTSGFAANDSDAFAANGRLAGFGLAHDASTYYAPAFINQSEGKLEKKLQPEMTRLLPSHILDGASRLELALSATGQQVVQFFAGSKAAVLLRVLNERLDDITRAGGKANELLQSPSDVANFLFKGSERNLLEHMRDAILGVDGRFLSRVDQIVKDIPVTAHELAEIAEAARDERKAAQSSGGAAPNS